ncbi:Riboflavin kinase domain bacterial/eukaryotic [Penicillium concentricum]|uniref:Riboflavin kinase domain bacterial/eukaryotic n=1 Tax=Penicillium concentricum TaxID=293559 RepID=A0A9W9SB75_9EURO|nr:Riboflavin kinase domain bacterial/eukaryotic [Penicillium concentricum]KAJ5375185.1 Riboflavin kinase domain bacterial/eukaryotic [Penicillium concentricum]
MVNVFQRLTRRRASSSSSKPPDQGGDTTGPNSAASHPHGLHRAVSTSSGKRNWRYEEPAPRHLILVSDTAEFDTHVVHRFQAEGFDVIYIPFLGSRDEDKDRKALENAIHAEEDELENGERYAIVAYHRPAYLLLASHHTVHSNTNPFPHLCALIAYYPISSTDEFTYRQREDCSPPGCSDTSSIFGPVSKSTYLPIQVHVPGPRVQTCALWPWISLSASEGDVTYKKKHRCYVYSYPGSRAGFAEREIAEEKEGEVDLDLNADDEIGSQLAWSRALACLRRSFNVGSHWPVIDIETVWEEYWDTVVGELETRKRNDSCGSEATVGMLTGHGHHGEIGCPAGEVFVKCIPTQAGGSDISSLKDFFTHAYIPAGPIDQHVRLLSRTVGADRIVDEILFSCRHTAEVPWLLPGVPPTDRDIRVIVVVVASFSAGQITRQSLYWDQAGVLVQAGLLDPGLVPSSKAVETH